MVGILLDRLELTTCDTIISLVVFGPGVTAALALSLGKIKRFSASFVPFVLFQLPLSEYKLASEPLNGIRMGICRLTPVKAVPPAATKAELRLFKIRSEGWGTRPIDELNWAFTPENVSSPLVVEGTVSLVEFSRTCSAHPPNRNIEASVKKTKFIFKLIVSPMFEFEIEIELQSYCK